MNTFETPAQPIQFTRRLTSVSQPVCDTWRGTWAVSADRPLEALFEHLRSKAPTDRRYALKLAYLDDYLVRNDVALGPELTQGVHYWRRLQHAANHLTVLPVVAPGPVTMEVAQVPRPQLSLPPVVLPLPPRPPPEGPPCGSGHGAVPRIRVPSSRGLGSPRFQCN